MFTDIAMRSWVDRHLPPWMRLYARLMRLDRPIGTWLLLLPCWWAVVLAGGLVPNVWYLFLFALGAVLMRGAGCIINDIYDRNIDKFVERTQTRPLASGELAVWQAVVLSVVLLVLALGVLLLFNGFTQGLGFASLVLVFLYPLAKRVTWWPQLVLGLAFNWGALMGWSAVHGGLGLPPLLLYASGVFWTLGYDTIYAHQDKNDDAAIGVKSLALRLGVYSKLFVGLFYLASLALLALTGYAVSFGTAYYAVLAVAAAYAAWLVALWNPEDQEDCLRCFRSNRNYGLIVLAAILAGKML